MFVPVRTSHPAPCWRVFSTVHTLNGAMWWERAQQSGERRSGNPESPWTRDGMSAEEAQEILGVSSEATDAEIEKAYRRKMKRAHPDQGGSDWMAAKVNQAKDVLLRD